MIRSAAAGEKLKKGQGQSYAMTVIFKEAPVSHL